MPDAVVLYEPEELAPLVRDDGLATEAAPISVLEPDSVVEQAVAACLRRPGVCVDVLAGVTGAKKGRPDGRPFKEDVRAWCDGIQSIDLVTSRFQMTCRDQLAWIARSPSTIPRN